MGGGDILLNSTGRPEEVDGLDKVTQDVAETLINEYDSGDPPWYPTGAEFFRLLGRTYAYNSDEIANSIETMAYEAVERLVVTQEEDPYVDDAELIADVRSIRAFSVGDLSWAFYVYLVTDSDEQIKSGGEIDLSQQLPSSLSPDGDHITGIGTPL